MKIVRIHKNNVNKNQKSKKSYQKNSTISNKQKLIIGAYLKKSPILSKIKGPNLLRKNNYLKHKILKPNKLKKRK